jgi:hypothetical protein
MTKHAKRWMVMVVDPLCQYPEDVWFLTRAEYCGCWKPYLMQEIHRWGPPTFQTEAAAIRHMRTLYRTPAIQKELTLCALPL